MRYDARIAEEVLDEKVSLAEIPGVTTQSPGLLCDQQNIATLLIQGLLIGKEPNKMRLESVLDPVMSWSQ
jgi:hypothetical protein